MSIYRGQIPTQYIEWLTAPGGTLGTLADQVRDAETDPGRGYEPGWTYFDGSAIAVLRNLPDDWDGAVRDEEDGSTKIWFERTPYDLESVQS